MSDSLFLLWLDWTIKSSIVMALALMLVTSLRRCSATLRHSIWGAALLLTLSLPVLAWLVPSWTVWLPTPDSLQASLEPGQYSLLKSSVVILWLGGGFILVIPVMLGHAVLASKWRRCVPLAPEQVTCCSREVPVVRGWRHTVPVGISREVRSPLTWGFVFPVIMLPEDARHWSQERLEVVIAHEMAHVRRYDFVMQWIALIARSIFWFHPLAWVAVRNLRREQEAACDDSLIASGTDPCDYAEHLLSITTRASLAWLEKQVASTMGKTPFMEQRIRAILDRGRVRGPLSPQLRLLVGLAGVGIAIGVSAGRFAPQPPTEVVALLDSPQFSMHAWFGGGNASTESAFQGRPTEMALRPVTAPEGPAWLSVSNRMTELDSDQPFDAVGSISEAIQELKKLGSTELEESQLALAAIRGMLYALPDAEFNSYFSADEFESLNRRSRGFNIGVGAWFDTDKQIRVISPLPGSPALKAGLRAGDLVLAIDDQQVDSQAPMRTLRRIAGKEGVAVKLKVRHRDGSQEDISIVRRRFQTESVHGFHRQDDFRWNYWLDDQQKIGYLMIDEFGPSTPSSVRSVVERLVADGAQGLIIDLRFSPGGMLQSAIETADLFLSSGPIVTIRSPNEERVTEANAAQIAEGVPLLVLINEKTASAAEALAGSLQSNSRAVLLGSRSFGKGSVQSIVPLSQTGGALRITTAQFQVDRSRTLQRTPGSATWGVDPDDGFQIALNNEQTELLRQAMLERSIVDPDQEQSAGESTIQRLLEQSQDPQLTAAIAAMTARIETGKFSAVGRTLQDHSVVPNIQQRLQDAKAKRHELLRQLELLDQEVHALNQVQSSEFSNTR